MKKAVVFGVGDHLKSILPEIEAYYHILCIADNNQSKHHTYFKSYPVISPDELSETDFDVVVMASILYAAEIFSQLLHMGISEDRIIFDYVSSVKRIYVKDLLNMQRNNKGRFNHTDIIVKYNVIKSDIERTLCNADNLYMEMQRKKLHISDDEAETRLQAFRKLYRSVGRKWDASSGTIVCDTKLQIMEGAHQLACCLYYHQPIVNVRVVPGKTSTDYSTRWF